MIKVGDLVKIKSRKDNVIFRVNYIDNNSVQLKGEVIRLLCTSQLDDLVPCTIDEVKNVALPAILERDSKAIIKGKVLHLDGDEVYLKKALKAYRQYGVKAIGYYIPEERMPETINTLLHRHNPDIVVITGHDALLSEDKSRIYDISNYRNSSYFISATKECREYKPDLDSLVVIAGACQSFYEALIENGANFASSPSRENIHLFDPVIIASEIALTPVYEYAKIERVLSNTINKNMGGLDTRGQARRIYLGGKSSNDT